MEIVDVDKNRPLYIFKYLLDHTDEEHPAIITDIIAHLEANGIHATRKTVASDLVQLQDCGFDVVCNKSRQNQYFIGSRELQIAELKTIVDAVQAAKFISSAKSKELIGKLSKLASPYEAEQLQRRLYVDGKAKTENEAVYYTVDLLHAAINHEKPVMFKYIEYTSQKEKVFKHDGQLYKFSPYDLVWNNDSYYVFGWSESHGKVVKFRVDRMYKPEEAVFPYHPRPEDYDIEAYCNQVFMMYDGEPTHVTLRCDNAIMKAIIDRFGESVKTLPADEQHFLAEVDVSISPTFHSWVFTYGGKMQILSPESISKEYQKRLTDALKHCT